MDGDGSHPGERLPITACPQARLQPWRGAAAIAAAVHLPVSDKLLRALHLESGSVRVCRGRRCSLHAVFLRGDHYPRKDRAYPVLNSIICCTIWAIKSRGQS